MGMSEPVRTCGWRGEASLGNDVDLTQWNRNLQDLERWVPVFYFLAFSEKKKYILLDVFQVHALFLNLYHLNIAINSSSSKINTDTVDQRSGHSKRTLISSMSDGKEQNFK